MSGSLLLVGCGGAPGAATASFSPVNSVTFSTGGASGGTTGAIDTTGATLLLLSLSWYAGPVAFTDSKGNTWTPLLTRASTDGSHQFFYVINPIVGTGHTFSISGTSVYCAMVIFAFRGPSSPVFQSETGQTAGGSPLQTGSMTPTKDGALVVTGFGTNSALNPMVTPGFTQVAIPAVGGVCIAGSFGYLVQTTAAPINPTWTWTSNPTAAIATAIFLPS